MERQDDEHSAIARPGWMLALVACALVTGAYQALTAVPEQLLYGDEFHSLAALDQHYDALLRSYGVNGSGGALLLIQRLGLDLFGATPWALRFPALLGVLGSLLLVYPVGTPLVGRAPAAVATLALALSPLHVFYSHFGRSYALVICLSLLFVLLVQRSQALSKPTRLGFLGVTLSAALLAYVHFAAVAFVALVGGASVASEALQPERRRQARWMLASLATAAGLAAALYFPAREPFWQFVAAKAAQGASRHLSILDVANLLAGGHTQALIWLIGAPLAAALVLKRRGAGGVLLVTAAFAMLPALLVVRPLGDSYAYARYLLPGLPFVLMLLAWGIEAALRAPGLSGRRLAHAVLATGACAVLTSWATGPLGPAYADDGPFGASYLSLRPLPAFDAPWPGASPFYDELARDEASSHIIEVPELKDQAIALYRNHYLRHRKHVSQGIVYSELPASTTAWVAPLSDARSTGADYLVLHLDVRRELSDYWRFVFQDRWNAQLADARLAGFMAFHRSLYVPPPPEQSALVPQLEALFGAPTYRDTQIAVWRLDGLER